MSATETRCPRCGSPERAVRACVRDFDHEPHLVMLSSQHCDGTPWLPLGVSPETNATEEAK